MAPTMRFGVTITSGPIQISSVNEAYGTASLNLTGNLQQTIKHGMSCAAAHNSLSISVPGSCAPMSKQHFLE